MPQRQLSSRYALVRYDYASHNQSAIATYSCRRTVHDELWNYALSYLQLKDGVSKLQTERQTKSPGFIFNKHKFKDIRSKLVPGHYIVRDPDDHVQRITIWEKGEAVQHKSGGRTSVKLHWHRVFDLDLIEIPTDILLGLEKDLQSAPVDSVDHVGQAENRARITAFGRSIKDLPCMLMLRDSVDQGKPMPLSELYRRCPKDFGSDEEPYVPSDIPEPLKIKRSYFKRGVSLVKRKLGLKKKAKDVVSSAVDVVEDVAEIISDDSAETSVSSPDMAIASSADASVSVAVDASPLVESVTRTLSNAADTTVALEKTASSAILGVIAEAKAEVHEILNKIENVAQSQVQIQVQTQVQTQDTSADQTQDQTQTQSMDQSPDQPTASVEIPAPCAPVLTAAELARQMEDLNSKLKLAKSRHARKV